MGKIRHIYHIIFITKGYNMSIPMEEKDLLLDRMTQIFAGKGCPVYAINAFLNHVHVLVEIPRTENFNRIMNKVKSSTGALYRKNPEHTDFVGWMYGFDSFSVSFGDIQQLKQRIDEQQSIHQELSFEEEYRQLLEENGFSSSQTLRPASPPTNNHKKRD